MILKTHPSDLYPYIIGFNSFLALMFNGTLVYLILNYTRKAIGNYKYLLLIYAFYNIVYTSVVFFGMPMNYLSHQSWFVIARGLISQTSFAFVGPSLFCAFYQTWFMFLAVHFVYRYIIVCRPSLAEAIQRSRSKQVGLVLLFLTGFSYALFCGLKLCRIQKLTKALEQKLRNEFNLGNEGYLGYISLRTKMEDGSVAYIGCLTIINHFVLANVSIYVILFCGAKIYMKIAEIQRSSCDDQISKRQAAMQRQLLKALIVQTTLPFIFCHIPTLIYLSYPFWNTTGTPGPFSGLLAVMMSLNPMIDPAITILSMTDYRNQILRLLSCKFVTVTNDNLMA